MECNVSGEKALPCLSFLFALQNLSNFVDRRDNVFEELQKHDTYVFPGYASAIMDEVVRVARFLFLVEREHITGNSRS